MTTKHVIKLSEIMKYFKEEEKLIAKGENALESGHVKAMVFDSELRLIKGEVQASMRDRDYKVEINFNEEWGITSATCSCPRGLFICHHMATLALYGHANVATTDISCAWSATKSKVEKVVRFNDIYPARSHRSTERNASGEEVEALFQKLSVFDGAVGYTWLLQKEPSIENDLVPNVEDVLFCDEYIKATNKNIYFLDKMKVDIVTIEAVANATVGQQKNEQWLLYRKHRLTASNFGVVLKAARRGRFPPSLFKRLAGSYDLDHIKAIQWGREHEKQGFVAAEKTLNVKIQATGLWLHECGFVGASPDGFVGDRALIEVKCPYKYREQSLTTGIRESHDYIIMADASGLIVVNKEHEYFYQIQGQLAITGRQLCYLVVWTPKEVVIVEVPAEDFIAELNILKDFYVKHYIPFILGEKYSVL